MATYVVSDLHGQYGIFQKLLEKAGFSDGDRLYMLGDAIDRGPDGIKILKHVMDAGNMEFLLGNHELMMLTSVDPWGKASASYAALPGLNSDLWVYYNGGNKTYYKYKLLKQDERVELLEWLRSRPLVTTVEAGGRTFILTHSYFELDKIDVPYSKMGYKNAWNIVWRSPYRPDLYVDREEYYALSPWVCILGHVPACHADYESHELAPYLDGNIIDIDGCCAHSSRKDRSYKGGILLRLDDLKVFTCSFAEAVRKK